jgi:hypothetical protein
MPSSRSHKCAAKPSIIQNLLLLGEISTKVAFSCGYANDNSQMQAIRFFVTTATALGVLGVLLLTTTACTPKLNWREVRLESASGSALKAQLPCKPDAATRKQLLGNIQVELSMMGCVADKATFTLSRIPLTDPLTAPQVLAAWQAAAISGLNAKPAPLRGIKLAGASAWPATARVTLAGTTAQAELAWFAQQTPAGLTLYQAGIYVNAPAKQLDADAVTTFFESLQIQ